MALTTYGIVLLIGATLSLRFNVFILFPAIGLALIGTIAVGIAHGDPMGSVVLKLERLSKSGIWQELWRELSWLQSANPMWTASGILLTGLTRLFLAIPCKPRSAKSCGLNSRCRMNSRTGC
jgi:hypothetical protein